MNILLRNRHTAMMDHSYSAVKPKDYQERIAAMWEANDKMKEDLSKFKKQIGSLRSKYTVKRRSAKVRELRKTIEKHLKTIQNLEADKKKLQEKVLKFESFWSLSIVVIELLLF